MKKWPHIDPSGLGVIVLIVLILFGLLEMAYYFGQRSMWREIENPPALVNECRVLIEEKEKGNLPFYKEREGFKLEGTLMKDSWPVEINKLRPISVSVTKERVSIMLSTGGIDACYGYLVSFEEIPNVPTNYRKWPIIEGLRLQKSKHPNIYKWQGVE